MPRQNRVTPWGEIIATPERGTLMGNRGCLHDDAGQIRRPYRSVAWIFCTLSYRGRRQAIMAPNRYTQLFFLDEATALAAGHRPCALCLRPTFTRFLEHWRRAHPAHLGPSGSQARPVDARLHRERLAGGGQATVTAPIDDLPDGAMLRLDPDGPAHLVLADALLPWSAGGYGPPRRRPVGAVVTVLTPPSIVAVLAAGYAPALHPTAATANHRA